MKRWIVLLVQPGIIWPENPGPVRYKAPDRTTWAIVEAETRERAEELACRDGEEVYGSALLSEWEIR